MKRLNRLDLVWFFGRLTTLLIMFKGIYQTIQGWIESMDWVAFSLVFVVFGFLALFVILVVTVW